jgi:hypothetical protein
MLPKLKQSNSLRKLHIILRKAFHDGDVNKLGVNVLLDVMNLESGSPGNIIEFYRLLSRAKEETESIRNMYDNDDHLKSIIKLNDYFVENNLLASAWHQYKSYLETTNSLLLLDSFANNFHRENPTFLLDQDFLDKLDTEFSTILKEIISSDLSKEFKETLVTHIEEILRVIRRYHIDGTKGLKRATQSLVSDLVMSELGLKNEDKTSPTYNKFEGWILSLLIYLAPTPWDIIGAAPDIEGYWVPKFEQLVTIRNKIEPSICEASTISEAFDKATIRLKEQDPKMLEGTGNQRSLPPARESPAQNKPKRTRKTSNKNAS